jgi:hypothetical protein
MAERVQKVGICCFVCKKKIGSHIKNDWISRPLHKRCWKELEDNKRLNRQIQECREKIAKDKEREDAREAREKEKAEAERLIIVEKSRIAREIRLSKYKIKLQPVEQEEPIKIQ